MPQPAAASLGTIGSGHGAASRSSRTAGKSLEPETPRRRTRPRTFSTTHSSCCCGPHGQTRPLAARLHIDPVDAVGASPPCRARLPVGCAEKGATAKRVGQCQSGPMGDSGQWWRRGGDSNPRARLAGLTVFEKPCTLESPYPCGSARARLCWKSRYSSSGLYPGVAAYVLSGRDSTRDKSRGGSR